MPTENVEDIEPFIYPVTPQGGQEGVSGNEIAQHAIEDWLNRLLQAVKDDLESIREECCGGP